MKDSIIKRYGIVFLLLLVFFQQIGAGLYIHNRVHNNKESHSQHNEAAKEINFACSCVDDFLTPCIEVDHLVLEPPITVHSTCPVFFAESIYITSVIFPSLRGPPVFIG